MYLSKIKLPISRAWLSAFIEEFQGTLELSSKKELPNCNKKMTT